MKGGMNHRDTSKKKVRLITVIELYRRISFYPYVHVSLMERYIIIQFFMGCYIIKKFLRLYLCKPFVTYTIRGTFRCTSDLIISESFRNFLDKFKQNWIQKTLINQC